MSKQINVLIFPCGKENALELHQSLRYNVNVKVFGASSVRDHGALVYENYIGDVPYIQSPNFAESFKAIIKQNNIDVVIPTHDTITLFFAEHKALFDCTIICPGLDAALVCREKLKTYALFQDCNFLPKLFQQNDAINFPVFVKPNIGEGAKNIMLCETQEKLEAFISSNEDLIICEYLSGKEFTVDCFTNYKGELLFAGPRLRNRIQMGIAFNSTTHALTQEIEEIAKIINNRIRFNGLWYFQLKEDAIGKLKLLEVSARVAGTMVVYRMTGVNFGLLSVYNALGKDVSILKNNFNVELDRCLHNRYLIDIDFDTVYIDYDDTIIINEKVNDVAMQFIYQMLNKNKKIVLLTKHAGDLNSHLAKYRIAPSLFDDIYQLKETENKTDYIVDSKAIFIDNAFAEREAILKNKGIPVFDVDAIECLIV
jgi:predicted ATP-grasp superfamily ATP-dependent carboligase